MSDTIYHILIGVGAGVSVALLYAHIDYVKILKTGTVNLKTIYGTYTIEEAGHGFSFLGVGKLLKATMGVPLVAPEFYIDAYKKEKPLFNAPLYYARSQRLQLEGDFSDFFDLYVPLGHEQEALQVLTPDLMLFLRDNLSAFDIHIMDNELIMTCLKTKANEAVLSEALEKVSQQLYRVFHKDRFVEADLGLLPTLKKDTSTETRRVFGFRIKARLIAMLILALPTVLLLVGGYSIGVPLKTLALSGGIVAAVMIYIYKKNYFN